MTLQIIGAGFGRTGTVSLKAALETLGFAPCDHMGEVFHYPERAALWMEAAAAKERGMPFDWERLYGGYEATTDWPGAFFWRELAAAYPEAKVLLSTRDPQRWYESMRRTIYPIRQNGDLARRVAAMQGVEGDLSWMPALVDRIVLDGTFHGRFLERDHVIQVFTDHLAAVTAAIAPERLLVFDVHQGWEPLCAFLDVPVPAETPFPHLNDSASLLATLGEGEGQRAAGMR